MLRPFCSAGALVVVCLPFVVSAQQVPCKPTVVGRLDIVPVTSRIFHNTRNLRVWLPPAYDPLQKYPVLYILDGASAFYVCASFNYEEMQADQTLTELLTTGEILPPIAVGIATRSDAIPLGDIRWTASTRAILRSPRNHAL